ncbi:hypothetical protein LQ757_02390 [Agromyces sp. SYSU K20354]|uniref:hypothetical protein n=1 Tax=Agromyces cavernae TaxID=2898659 RepID=UPI001E60B02F|nr:hypothetical protein [Agromyces cavernae]MCD2441116.1 hypothetical protein [Agromyces cavernae]
MTHLRIALTATAMSAALALGLGGCAAAQPSASEGLRDSVVQIAQRASVEDFTGAMAELLLLERSVDAAVAAGELDGAREAEIRAAIELVRADLDAAATPTPTPTPTPTDGDNDGDGDNSGPGNSGDNRNDGNGKKDKGGDGDEDD